MITFCGTFPHRVGVSLFTFEKLWFDEKNFRWHYDDWSRREFGLLHWWRLNFRFYTNYGPPSNNVLWFIFRFIFGNHYSSNLIVFFACQIVVLEFIFFSILGPRKKFEFTQRYQIGFQEIWYFRWIFTNCGRKIRQNSMSSVDKCRYYIWSTINFTENCECWPIFEFDEILCA